MGGWDDVEHRIPGGEARKQRNQDLKNPPHGWGNQDGKRVEFQSSTNGWGGGGGGGRVKGKNAEVSEQPAGGVSEAAGDPRRRLRSPRNSPDSRA